MQYYSTYILALSYLHKCCLSELPQLGPVHNTAKEQAKGGTKKRKANDKPSGSHKRRNFALTIKVLNLEIDEGIEKLRTNAGDNEEDIEDVTRVREALRGLFGDQDDVLNEVLERRMEKLMRAMMMEVVETEE